MAVLAKIQTLILEEPFYRVGDEIVSPVLDILVVTAPAFIKHTCVDTSTVVPMTTEVHACVVCNLSVLPLTLRNTKTILLHTI